MNKAIKRSFSLQLSLFVVAITIVFTAFISGITYQYVKHRMADNLASQLLAIVNSSSALLNGDEHEKINFESESKLQEKNKLFFFIDTLNKIKQANQLQTKTNQSSLYTLRKTDSFNQSNNMEIVAITDNEDRYAGYMVKAKPHHLSAYQGVSSTTEIYQHKGLWISAAAPIYNSAGKVVAILQADRNIEYYQEELDSIARQLMMAAIITILLGIVVTMYFARSFTSPLRHLTKTVGQFGEGDWAKRAIVKREDEFGQLAAAFNAMAERLQNFNKMQGEHNVSLLEAKDKAEQGEKAKAEFLATMSHEMRTPLTAIIGFAEQVKVQDQQNNKLLQTVIRNSHHLLQIINDVLDLTKLEVKALEVEEIECKLIEIIEHVFTTMVNLANEKGLEYSVNYDYPIPKKIISDPLRLQQIIFNLLSNAVKFTQKGSVKIQVAYNADTNFIKVSVKDTGIGITDEQKEQLFKAFSQAESTTTRVYGGTGLGLYISQRLLDIMGGNISLHGEYGHGSEFIVELPCGDAGEFGFIQSHEDLAALKLEQESHSLASTPSLKGNILLAEDWEDNQQLVALLVSQTGADLSIRHNGKLAVEEALTNSYDLILMDIHMPEMDGIEATKILRDIGCEVPIVAITANVMEDHISAYKKAGFNDFLTKPIDTEHFYEVLDQYLPDSDELATEQSSVDTESLDKEMDLLIQGFRKRLPDTLEQLKSAEKQQDLATMNKLAHNLKGTAKTFGFPKITDIAGEMDKAFKQEEIELALSVYPRLVSALEEANRL